MSLSALLWAAAQVTKQFIILDLIDYQHIPMLNPKLRVFLLYFELLPKLPIDTPYWTQSTGNVLLVLHSSVPRIL